MRMLRIIASAMVLAFLVFAPAPLKRALERDPARELFETDDPDWYGVIEVWHIAGFRTYQGSVTTFLQEQCDTFARKHPGVHIEVTGLTPAMFEERLARGHTPDAYSFPAGSLAADLFRPLEAMPPIFRDGLDCGDTETMPLAAPYLMSGYFLLFNEQRALANGGMLPSEADSALLHRLQEEGQLTVPPAIANELQLTGESKDYGDFLSGKHTAAIADARALGDLMRSTEQNLLVTALPLGGYTDQLMCFGTSKNTDDHRAALIGALYEYLLSEDVQPMLTTLGAMPVRKYTDTITYASSLLTDLNRAYLSDLSVPHAFVSPSSPQFMAE